MLSDTDLLRRGISLSTGSLFGGVGGWGLEGEGGVQGLRPRFTLKSLAFLGIVCSQGEGIRPYGTWASVSEASLVFELLRPERVDQAGM